MSRRLGKCVVLVAVLGTLLFASSSQASADPFPGTSGSYQYSEIFTNRTSAVDSCGYCPAFNANDQYRGWLGVNGAIQILGSAGSMGANDHALAALSASGSDGSSYGDFLQAGVFKGKVFESTSAPSSCQQYTCVNSASSYSVYFETQQNTFGFIASYGLAGTAANVFRIQGSGGSWHVYDLYNNEFAGGPFARSWNVAAMIAQDETFDYQASNVAFAPTNVYFGASDPNTNAAMRLMGSQGYEPWDTGLIAGGSMRVYDTTVSPLVHQSVYSSYYKWGAY